MTDAKGKSWDGAQYTDADGYLNAVEVEGPQNEGCNIVRVYPRETAEALRECVEFLRQPVPAYHNHFDTLGQSGAGYGCASCNAFREWKAERDATLARLDAAGGAE